MAILSVRLASSHLSDHLSLEEILFFGIIGFVFAATLVYGLWLRRNVELPLLARIQLGGDLVVGFGLTWLTGGLESPFVFIFFLTVIFGAMLLELRGALFAAVASTACFVVITVMEQAHMAGGSPQSFSRWLFLLSVNVLGAFLIAVLAGYLARQLAVTGGRLLEREAHVESLERIQDQILSCMPSGLLTCEADGKVSFINPAARQILSLERHKGGLRVDEVIPGALGLEPGAPRSELSVHTAKGTKVLGLSLTRLEGRPGGSLVVFRDLTELRRVEEDLRRADRLASLGRLSAQLAHEIRNPLASMRGSAQLIAAGNIDDAQRARLANVLVRESDRLGGLVEDFLRFARPAEPKLSASAVDALTRQVMEMVRLDPLSRGVHVTEALEPAVARMDRDQILQVMLNLLRNALAAAGSGGEVKVGLRQADGRVSLSVWDSGGSIRPEDMPRLFEPFFSSKPGGTGLGLATAHSIVHAHGGSIEVTSSKEQGTEFVVSLPGVVNGSR